MGPSVRVRPFEECQLPEGSESGGKGVRGLVYENAARESDR
jgi:hypothetical protein